MAAVYKILGQSRPGSTNNTVLYTAPAGTSTIVSTITATNVTTTARAIRIFIVPPAGSPSEANALVYDPLLESNTVQAFTIGVTLQAGSTLQVRSSFASAITFQAFGQEIS